MKRTWTQRSLFLVLAAVGGCNVVYELFPGLAPTVGSGSPELKAFTSQEEMEAYFKQQLGQRNADYTEFNRDVLETTPSLPGGEAVGDGSAMDDASGLAEAPPSSAPTDGDHSGTTIQEAGVDEADVVKTDGTYLYMIDTINDGSVLRIVRANPTDSLGVVSETDLEGYGRDLYLRGDKVVAVTTGGGFYYYPLIDAIAAQDVAAPDEPTGVEIIGSEPVDGDAISIAPPFGGDEYQYERPHTIVTVVDASDTANPRVLSQTKFDGTQSATRMIDGVLHMVISNYQEYYFDVLPMLGRPELNVDEVQVEVILPEFTRLDADESESAGPVVTWREMYYPVDPDGFGTVTLVSLDVDNDGQFTAVGVVAEPGLIYSSLEAMYLTNTSYDYLGNARTTTNVYKFDYENRGARPVATGAVPGRILNQYSMSEYQGNLRAATTLDAQFTCNFFECAQTEEAHNNVYVLSQVNDTLSEVGSVRDIAPRETIQAARFIGDRGYVVTFLQTDPLFTLDLSDPTNPRVVGELEVPGFSTYLTPMDANHLLAVGQYVPPPGAGGTWGVQVSIFDVTDFANPTRTSNVIIGGDSGAYSEAIYDPKAFTYFASQGLVALPVSVYATYIYDDGGGTGGVVVGDGGVSVEDSPIPVDDGFDGVVVFRATPEAGLSELGRISTRFEESPYWGTSFTRGVFIEDKFYAVTNLGVREAPSSSPSSVEHELFYGPVFVEEPPVIVEPEPVPIEVIDPIDGGTVSTDGSGASSGSAGRPTDVSNNP